MSSFDDSNGFNTSNNTASDNNNISDERPRVIVNTSAPRGSIVELRSPRSGNVRVQFTEATPSPKETDEYDPKAKVPPRASISDANEDGDPGAIALNNRRRSTRNSDRMYNVEPDQYVTKSSVLDKNDFPDADDTSSSLDKSGNSFKMQDFGSTDNLNNSTSNLNNNSSRNLFLDVSNNYDPYRRASLMSYRAPPQSSKTQVAYRRRPWWKWWVTFEMFMVPPTGNAPFLIKPWFPWLTRKLLYPSFLMSERTRKALITLWLIIWAILFSALVYVTAYAAHTEFGYPHETDCFTNFWGDCGVGGVQCQPFANKSIVVRCYANCGHVTWKTGWHEEKLIKNFKAIIGTDVYRADSWVCPSAIHAGVINNRWGGCVKVDFVGAQSSFKGSEKNDQTSLDYSTWFPKSYRLSRVENAYLCEDNSIFVIPLTGVMALVFLMLRPSKKLFFWVTYVVGYWDVVFFAYPVRSDTFISEAIGTFIASIFVGVLFYKYIAKPVLPGPNFPIDTYILYSLPILFGLYMNQWATNIPDFSITAENMEDSTIMTMVLTGAAAIFVLAIFQLYYIRKVKLLPKYIFGYVVIVIACFIFPTFLYLDVHIHHWLVAMLLIPMTRVQLRSSLIFQAILLGVFLNGVARWGLDTPLYARFSARPAGGGGRSGNPIPTWTFNTTKFNETQTLEWRFIPTESQYDIWAPRPTVPANASLIPFLPANATNVTIIWPGFGDIVDIPAGLWVHGYSVKINDIEVYRGPKASFNISRYLREATPQTPFYIRAALTTEGSATLSYTSPWTLYANGTVIKENGSKYISYPPPPTEEERKKFNEKMASSTAASVPTST